MTHTITTDQGLSHNVNAFLHRDELGFMWISSIDGLNRFDGRSVKVYKPEQQNKTAIYGANIQGDFFEDGNHDLWFATELSINRYRRKNGDFEHFFVQKDTHVFKNVPYHLFHLEANRFLWLNTENNIFRFDTWKPQDVAASFWLHPLVAVRYAVAPKKGPVSNLFACFWNYGKGFETTSYDKNYNVIHKESFLTTANGKSKKGLEVSQVYVENDTAIWMSCSDGLLLFNPKQPQKYRIFSPDNQTVSGVALIHPLVEHQLLVATNDNRFVCFDKTTKRFLAELPSLDIEQLNPSNDHINSMFLDKANILWYSLSKQGVVFKNIKSKRFYSPLNPKNFPDTNIKHLIEDQHGNVFCTTENGQTYFLDKQKSIYQSQRFQQYSQFFAPSRTEDIWNVTDNALICYDKTVQRCQKTIPLDGMPIYSFICVKNDFYIGTPEGIMAISKDGNGKKIIKPSPDLVLSLFLDRKNTLWAGSTTGLECFHDNDIKNAQTFLNTGAIHHIVEDTARHLIWAATSKGLLKIRNGDKPQVDTLITEDSGLPNQYLYAIVIDKNGNLWLSSNKGIIKYMPDSPPGDQFKHYTMRNGLSSNEYNRGAALMSSTGEIWFGSTQGVDVFHPDSVRDIGHAPQLAIVGLKIHDVEWHSDTVAIEMARRLDLRYNQNTLRFDLAAMEYTDPEMNKFRAVLEPIPNAWQRWLAWMGLTSGPDSVRWDELGTQNFITYANLSPGDYHFRFTACNSEGIWQKMPHELLICIHPPYWQTWWFRLLLLACALGLVGIGTAGYYRYRLRAQELESAQRERVLEQERHELERKNLEAEKELALRRQRDRVSADMHDELGGGLVSIGAQSKRAQKFQPAPEVQGILARIGDIAYTLNRNMRNLSWATDPEMDNLASLLSRLRKEARDFFDDHALEARIDIPIEAPLVALSGEFRLHILRAVLEALNNIAKHAQATEASLSVTIDGHFRINLRDNGVGFDPSEKSGTSKGLRSMSKRMEALGGTIEWLRNADGKDMTVVMEVPLVLP